MKPERAAQRLGDGEWSVLEVLAHLVATDHHYVSEALAMRDKPGHMLVHFDDAAWKSEHENIRDMPLAGVVESLTESHATVLRHLQTMSDADLDTLGTHPRGIPYTVRDVFLRLPQHDENHTRQIQEIVAALSANA
jgi:uncharacterized damage-inducible protein DinB